MAQTPEGERFAALLRMLKNRSGSSFEMLSKRSGISRSSLHRYCAGTKFPASYGTIHAFATACGASNDELRELHRLWALAGAARSSNAPSRLPSGATDPVDPAGPVDPADPADERNVGRDTGREAAGLEETGSKTDAVPSAVAAPARPRGRAPVVAAAATVCLAAAVSLALFLPERDRETVRSAVTGSPPGAAPATARVRVFNIEGDCKTREQRVPACSMGLARDPRAKYATGNVVGHRVWHGDVLETDCVLYDGDRVEDETGVGTTRWFRVRLDDVPGGLAWLPAVRTHDDPKLPVCG